MKVFLLVFNLLFLSAVEGKELSIMAYNVENLFDTDHDKGKRDWDFTPIGTPQKNEECKKISIPYFRERCLETDWNDEKLFLKMAQIDRVVKSIHKGGPDLLALVEVENKEVIERLSEELGYDTFVVANGPDQRGIDVALLVRDSSLVKIVKKHEIIIKDSDRPTRSILEVQLSFMGKSFFVYVNHWPSQRGPDVERLKAAKALITRLNSLPSDQKSLPFVAVGDFNTLSSDLPNGINYLKENGFEDLHQEYVKKYKNNRVKQGTYFYKKNKKWNLFDRILVKNFDQKNRLVVDLSSYQIIAKEFMLTSYYSGKNRKHEKIPKRYNFDTYNSDFAGFSDHLPVSFQIKSL